MSATLDTIRSKIRKVTGRPSPNQISDASIDEYINTYYLYDMPENLRLMELKDYYNFTTIPNIDTYDFAADQDFITVEPPAYAGGFQMIYYQSPEEFYRVWPSINFLQRFSSGDNSSGPYTGVLSNVPILKSTTAVNGSKTFNVLVSTLDANGNSMTAHDDGNGSLIDEATEATIGTINYTTGAIEVTFPQNVQDGAPINAQTIPYVAARPTDILFFNNQFVVRPVPDIAYQVQIIAYRSPSAFISSNPNQQPELKQWWQLLAYGAALKIFADDADSDQITKFFPLYEEQMLLVQRRTLKQLANQRAPTQYSDQGLYPYGNFYPLL